MFPFGGRDLCRSFLTFFFATHIHYLSVNNSSRSILSKQRQEGNIGIHLSIMTDKGSMPLSRMTSFFLFLTMALPAMGRSGVRKQRTKIASFSSTMESIRDSAGNRRELHKPHKIHILPHKKKKKEGMYFHFSEA